MTQSPVDKVLEHGNDWSGACSRVHNAVIYVGAGAVSGEYNFTFLASVYESGVAPLFPFGIYHEDFTKQDDSLAAPKLVSESHLHYADSNDAWLIESQQCNEPGADTARAPEAYDNQAPMHVPFWRR